jgi:5'-3' exoribonuclease 2
LLVLPVVEEEGVTVTNEDGKEITIPVNMADNNPNGMEYDSLYLDMNAIVSLIHHFPAHHIDSKQ